MIAWFGSGPNLLIHVDLKINNEWKCNDEKIQITKQVINVREVSHCSSTKIPQTKIVSSLKEK